MTALAGATTAPGGEKTESILRYPGVLANREKRMVEIEAQATGLTAGDTLEFLLINDLSGHGYESLALTSARPSHIRKALEFIGVSAGTPINTRQMRFWPRGGRVKITFQWDENVDGKKLTHKVPAGQMAVDRQTDKTFNINEFVFTGSAWVANATNSEELVLSADIHDPRSIISTYNDPGTLIDLPRQAPQELEYGNIVPNTNFILAADCQIKLILKPACAKGFQRELDLSLDVTIDDNGEELYELHADNGAILNKNTVLVGVLSELSKIIEHGNIPFLTIHFGAQMKISRINEICAFLRSIDSERGINIEPPLKGELYYRAFIPNQSLRNREERGLQPPELSLSKTKNGVTGVLIKAKSVWGDDTTPDESKLQIEESKLTDPSDFKNKLTALEEDIPILIIYAGKGLTLGEVMSFARPVLETHPTVFVFASDEK